MKLVCSFQEARAIVHQVGREGGDEKLYRPRFETVSLRKCQADWAQVHQSQGIACQCFQLALQQALILSSLLSIPCPKCFWSVLKIRFWGVTPRLVSPLKAEQQSAYCLTHDSLSQDAQGCRELMDFL